MMEVFVEDDAGIAMRFLNVNGFLLPPFPSPSTATLIFDSLKNFNFRDDDIMLCSYSKTGKNV